MCPSASSNAGTGPIPWAAVCPEGKLAVMLPCYLKSGRRIQPLPVTGSSRRATARPDWVFMQEVDETKLVGTELAVLW